MLQNYVYDDKEPVDFADSLQKAVAAVAGMDGGWFGNIVNILNSTTLTIQARETAFKALGNEMKKKQVQFSIKFNILSFFRQFIAHHKCTEEF